MKPKTVAILMLTLFAVFAVALVWVAVYVNNQTQRCASIGATYDGPGVCKFTHESRVPTP